MALQIPKDTGAAPHAEVHGIAEYDAQAAVARRLYHRLPEAGPYGHSHLPDDLSPLIPDQVQILQLGFRKGHRPGLRLSAFQRRGLGLYRLGQGWLASVPGHVSRPRGRRDPFLHLAFQPFQPLQHRIHGLLHLGLRQPDKRQLHKDPLLGRKPDLIQDLGKHADIPHQHIFIGQSRILPELLQIVLRHIQKLLRLIRRL